jgi:hypothetical protein
LVSHEITQHMVLHEKNEWELKMPHPLNDRKVAVKGILLPSEWDENGAVIALTLFTFDEDEYKVDRSETTRELLDVLQQELLVEGSYRWEQDRKIIRITEFHLFQVF